MKRTIRIRESLLRSIIREEIERMNGESDSNSQDEENMNKFRNNKFSLDYVRSHEWMDCYELINYCEDCNLFRCGSGSGRVVYAIDDERVIKIQRTLANRQNEKEVRSFMRCDNNMRQFVPFIFDWDKSNPVPLWIISEQVLTAKHVDFQKVLGINFGDYGCSADIAATQQDLKDYSQYSGKQIDQNSLNFQRFLMDYEDGDIGKYSEYLQHSPWLRGIKHLLDQQITAPWEIALIFNWGLVQRNGKSQLVILDIGI